MEIRDIKKQIRQICRKIGRDLEGITILAATKSRGFKEINEIVAAGISVIGENRVQELVKKIENLPKSIRVDFIGHLQTNKVKEVVRYCYLIHSVDSSRLANAIDKEAKKQNKIQNILLEVNIANEETKFGFKKDDVVKAFPKLLELDSIRIQGLMTIAPYFNDQEKSRPIFQELRNLKEVLEKKFNILLPELSMGMSNDYQIAVEENATILRLGRILFDI